MAGVIAVIPKKQFNSALGIPLVGGTLETYLAGTTTPVETYADKALTTSNGTSIELDARGECVLWLDPAVTYKFILKNAVGVLQWTQDDISGALNDSDLDPIYTAFAASGGAALIGTVSGTVASNLHYKLTAARTYYVRTDGSDSNTGLVNTVDGAFATLQKAINVIADTLDLNGFTVTVKAADGTYTDGVFAQGQWIGRGYVVIEGNTATPANCIVSTSGDCFAAESGARFIVKGFKVVSASASGIRAYLYSNVNYQDMEFSACGYNHVESGTGSTILCTGNYKVTGGAVGHLHVGSFGLISIPSTTTITLTGVPAFSAYFLGVAQGTVVWDAPTIVGTATGKQYLTHFGGMIRTASSFSYSSIPGSTDGTMEAGGLVTGSTTEPIKYGPDIYTLNSFEIQAVNFNTQAKTTFFRTKNDLATPKGWFGTNDDDCYSTRRTHFGGNVTAVDVTSGTTDGATFQEPGYAVLSMSNNSKESLVMRRRTTDGGVVLFYRDTTNVGSIAVSTTATSFFTSSDYRLKTNIVPLQGAWQRVKSLKPMHYEFKAEPGKVYPGFIAHELAEAAPHAVSGQKDQTDADGEPVYQGVDPGKLVADLTAALQEAMQRIEALEAK